MCGVVGVFDAGHATSREMLAEWCGDMADAVRHRGPDGRGVWVDAGCGIALGHRRLAVLDLSDAGAQPMRSRCGRYVLSFNGEVYNFRALRKELADSGSVFAGHSDTEVLLEAISRWSLLPALRRVNGMFAIALWDSQERRLSLVRDRLGEKPLYYGRAGDRLLFASELAALRRVPAFKPRVDRGALALLLRYSYIPSPHTIYEGVAKLPPGHVLHVGADVGSPQLVPFWSLQEVAERGTAEPFDGGDVEATDALEQRLRDAVSLRLEADVPLAVFLSGGIDSSLVTALAQEASAEPLHTFTVGVLEGAGPGDERLAAAAVAAHLGTDHEEVLLTSADALATVGRLPELWDEPFADPSQVPTAMLCSAARSRATVCLSGDGGDEVFGGYNRYVLGQAAWERSRRLPTWSRQLLARRLLAASPDQWDRRWQRAGALLPRAAQQYSPGTKLHKLAGLLEADDVADAYLAMVSQWRAPDEVVLGTREPGSTASTPALWPQLCDATQQMMYVDTKVGLPDDMLVKVDRASMAVGLEVRAPLLDPDLVEFAWTLPASQKVRAGQGKWLLRQVAARHIPGDLLDRPKLGFDPPLDAWLRGPLRPWAEDLLAAGKLRDEGLFDVAAVRGVWAEHLAGRRNHGYALWAVLMAQQWLDHHDAA